MREDLNTQARSLDTLLVAARNSASAANVFVDAPQRPEERVGRGAALYAEHSPSASARTAAHTTWAVAASAVAHCAARAMLLPPAHPLRVEADNPERVREAVAAVGERIAGLQQLCDRKA